MTLDLLVSDKTSGGNLLLITLEFQKMLVKEGLYYALYNDSLTDKLIESKVECHIDMQCITHALYADDIWHELLLLYNVCLIFIITMV